MKIQITKKIKDFDAGVARTLKNILSECEDSTKEKITSVTASFTEAPLAELKIKRATGRTVERWHIHEIECRLQDAGFRVTTWFVHLGGLYIAFDARRNAW